ncbi:MAG: DUF2510 domain-containing protein [Massilia sp.]|nr:MAG: DUF2510 domain-containing protein [Massilia sp.]
MTFTPWTTDHPLPGWHFASTDRDPELLRFWDGAAWSLSVQESAPEAEFLRNRGVPDTALPADPMWSRALSAASLAWFEAEGVHWHAAD